MYRPLLLTLAAIATYTGVSGIPVPSPVIPVPSPTEAQYVPVDFEGAMKLLEALSSKETITATTPPICVKKFLLQKTLSGFPLPIPSYAFQVEGCTLKEPNGKGYCPNTTLAESECRSAVFEVMLEARRARMPYAAFTALAV